METAESGATTVAQVPRTWLRFTIPAVLLVVALTAVWFAFVASDVTQPYVFVDLASGKTKGGIRSCPTWLGPMTVSPDERLVVLVPGISGGGSYWELRSVKGELLLKNDDSSCGGTAFSPDGKLFAAVTVGQSVTVWKTKPLRRLTTFSTTPAPFAPFTQILAFSPNCHFLAFGTGPTENNPSKVVIWKLNSPSEPRSVLNLPGKRLTALQYSSDGNTLAAGCLDGTIDLWTSVDSAAEAWTLSKTLRCEGETPCHLRFSHDGSRFAADTFANVPSKSGVICPTCSVRLWNTKTGDCIMSWRAGGLISGIDFSSDGGRLRLLTPTHIYEWDALAGELLLASVTHYANYDLISGTDVVVYRTRDTVMD